MNKLIKNEWKKLFSKKVMYILCIITVVFTVFVNAVYHMSSSFASNDDFYIASLEEQLENLDYHKEEDNEWYIELKTEYDLVKLKQQYEKDSWQFYFIDYSPAIVNCIRAINQNTYGFDKDLQKQKQEKEKYNSFLERLNNGNWKIFIQEDLEEVQEEKSFYEEQLKNMTNQKQIEDIQSTLKDIEIRKQTLEWRLEKEEPYGNSFLSGKIEEYLYGAFTVNRLEMKENKTKEEEQEYKTALKQMQTSQYYIEHDIRIKNENDGRYILTHLLDEYGIFVSVFAIIVAGTIVSNEFQKGTVKLLLTKPYTRWQILLAKYIVSILSIFLFIILFAVVQWIVGGIIDGFSIYKIPVVEFDFHTNRVITLSSYHYMFLSTVAKLPIYILLTTFAWALSTLTMNSAVSVALPILGNMASGIINLFIEKVDWIKYFVTANWDWSVYLFGGEGIVKGLNLGVSIGICFIYLSIMLITTFVVFQKRDIKNV